LFVEKKENDFMSELEQVKTKKTFITLAGKEREIKFGMVAFAKIEETYTDLDGMQKALVEKPFTTLPKVIYFAIKDKEGITEENIAELLDDGYDMIGLKNMITAAIGSAMPTAKKGKGNPLKAE
jgi:hypothetical protein